MRKTSSALPTSQRTSKVAEFIDRRLDAVQATTRKTIGQIADEAGLPQRNMLSMIRTGVTKLPFERIRGMAEALDVDTPHLLRMALEEYQPQLNELLNEIRGHILTWNEQEMLAIWRAESNDADPTVDRAIVEFKALARRLSADRA